MKNNSTLTPRGSPDPTPDQMLVELIEGARHFVQFERMFGAGGAGRRATIRSLKENAHKIGFAPEDIDVAVVVALATAEREAKHTMKNNTSDAGASSAGKGSGPAQQPKPRKKVVFRAHDWINLKTLKPVKSIQARFVGERGWMHVCSDGKPVFYKTERKRQRDLVRLEMGELGRRLAAKEKCHAR